MTKHRPPHRDFRENLTYQIDYTAHFNRTFRRKFHKIYMNNAITADEFLILALLENEPNISQTKMGTILFKGKAHVGKILNEMENKGFIERSFKPDNNTPINKVTAKGKEIFEKDIKKIGEIIVPKMDEEFTQEEIDQHVTKVDEADLIPIEEGDTSTEAPISDYKDN